MSQLFNQTGVAHDQFVGGCWPGVTIAISQDDKLVFAKSYGFEDMQAPQLTHPDDLYRLESDSKQLTGAAILMLIRDGQSVDGDPSHKLALDSKVFDILSSPPNASPARRPERDQPGSQEHHGRGASCIPRGTGENGGDAERDSISRTPCFRSRKTMSQGDDGASAHLYPTSL